MKTEPTNDLGPRPELQKIVEALKDAINFYDTLVYETKDKLQIIKRFEEPKNVHKEEKETSPECVLEEVDYLIGRLRNLNDIAESNLRHLRQIV